eukprot:3091990-Rhodomonas_salina.1
MLQQYCASHSTSVDRYRTVAGRELAVCAMPAPGLDRECQGREQQHDTLCQYQAAMAIPSSYVSTT